MSKKLFSKVFILLLVVGLLFAVAPAEQALAESPSVWDGTYPGTKPAGMLDPVGGVQEVHTAAEFAWLAKQTNMFQNGVVNTVKLMVDIDLNNKPWTPSIALGQGEDNGYVLDGNGKTISNLSINVYQPGTFVYAGMFVKSGDAIPMPTIRNLTIDGAIVTGTSDEYMRIYAGVLSASDEWRGNFENITITDAVVTGSKYVGGIAAYAEGNFINCSVTDTNLVVNEKLANATTRTIPHVGALVGLLGGGQVKGNTIDNIDIDLTPPTGYDVPETQIGALIGTAQASVLVGANSVSDVTLNDVIFTKLIGLDYRTYKVVNTTQMLGYTTIQAAIDAAADGDVIEVGPGTYNEAVIINKPNLTIRSTTGAASTIIDVPDGSLTTGVKFVGTNLGVLTFDGFTVKDFTEQGIVQGMGSATGTTVHVLNNVVIPAGTYLRNGIQVSGDGSTVIGNTVSNAYLTTDWGGTAIHVVNASNVIVRGNTVNGNGDVAIAIDNYNAALVSNILIENNIIAGSDVAINITGGPDTTGKIVSRVTITGNDLGNSLEGIDVSYVTLTGANTFEKNDFSGNTTYIAIYKDGYPTWGYPGANVTGTIDASPNWYGTALGPTLTNFYDDQLADPFAFDDPADFTYKPWCANAACTEFLPAMATIAPVAPVVCGNTTTTTIDVNISGIPASMVAQGYQLTLHFDPTKTSIASEDDIAQGGFLPLTTGFTVRTIDNVNGTVVIASTIFGTASNDPSKPLAKITLTHLGVTGDIALSLSDVLLSDADGQPIPADVSPTPVVLTLQPAVMNTTKSLGYCDLASAVAGAAGGDNLQLMANITSDVTITVDKALTLDTNGLTISRTVALPNNNSFVVVPGGDLTITGGGTITSNSGNAVRIEGNADTQAKVTLANATLYAPNASVVIIGNRSATAHEPAYQSLFEMTGGYTTETVLLLGNGAEADITGGTLTGYAPIMGNGTVDAVTNNGGTVITIGGTAVVNGNTDLAIYHPQDGLLTIKGNATITGTNGIEMKAGNLVVNGGTILGTGAYADPLPNDNGSADTGDAILLNGRDAYTGDITVNITGGTITSTNAYALRDYKAADQALKTSAVLVSGGSFTGGIQAVTFSDEFVALPRTATTGLMLTGGLYNTDPASPDVFVFVPYATVYNTTEAMYEIVGISLNVHDFYYNNNGILRGVSTDFTVTNFVIADANSVTVQLFSGAGTTESPWVLQQTNTLKTPAAFDVSLLSSSFDIFGTYVSNSWANTRATEYGQHVPPTRVLVTVVLPGGTLTGENLIPDFEYSLIQPSIVISDFGYWDQSGVRGLSAGVVATNFDFNQATDIKLELFAGTTLLQTDTAPTTSPLFTQHYTSISGPFDIFGTFDYVNDGYWGNVRQIEYGQTLVPTKVVATVTLPGGVILTAERENPTGDRTTILPGVSGLVTLQGILAPRAGVGITLTPVIGTPLTTLSTALSTINYGFTGVETLTYTFTTSQARYLNVTTASSKIFLVDRDLNLTDLRLYGGDVDQNNAIQVNDASLVGTNWGSTLNPEANINYDGIVNIQDLALVGGNFGLISASAYNWWSPLP